ncbi:MAG: GntR family transcriptional regulator, partial [Deltaproteobacteria bacterium]|nr:GntR family transcriptional regulator [Deltaproteobacteria bacterium]
MMGKTSQSKPQRKGADSEPPTTRRLNDVAYERIKEMILCGDLAPGESVSEAQLSDRLNMGKAPIRNALARLLQESLVQVVPRSGYMVAPLTLKDVNEIIEFRIILETAISQKALGRVDADIIRQLDKKWQVRYTPGDRGRQQGFLKANQEIHMTIAR